ncbi:TIGR01906 family membrane protein [Irregularibacter muris]|uniref:TIGR01906 family membrane protein n=1 Tax=Irregularibacter muris TaxID=1796619 RepID=A0AAE3HEC3_9FIRM|nr:TIGR01906 family membrane protein [Irregularibacter muris]MCR1898900.1 TIGR01906 family membrane protein [Irregularibacter muris]
MNKILNKISLGLIIITLPIVILLTCVEIATFNRSFYWNEYEKHQVMENTGIEKVELMDITEEMLDYLKGKREDLIIHGEVRGNQQLIFDERDQLHMVDVQKLFLQGFSLRNTCAIIVLLAALYLLLIKKDKKTFARGVFLSGVIALGTILLMGLIITTDFSRYFDMFHYIFFSNDLWRLDPGQSILINLVPLEFFINIAGRIAIYFFLAMGSCIALSGFYLRKINKRTKFH